MITRVLVVDDSIVARQALARALNAEMDLEALRPASNGKLGLARVHDESPDLVILDIEMPVMDGIETLKAIRKTHPKLPVIMFSALTGRGAAITMDALALGATDYLAKPGSAEGQARTTETVMSEMVAKVRAISHRAEAPAIAPHAPPIRTPPPRKVQPARHADLIVIGSSTGGPNALSQVLSGLPAELPAPILVAQHIPPMFSKQLAERLDSECKLRVREAHDGAIVQKGEVWIAPGNYHMRVQQSGSQTILRLSQTPKVNSCRPAVDPLFQSAAISHGNRVLAIVLTGMGKDGLAGCEHIEAKGGRIYAQDEATSVVWGMPGQVVRSGRAEKVLPLNQCAASIIAACAGQRTGPR